MPRLYHRKSSKGCVRCKQRRVKCDEVKPSCGACVRHQVECVYVETRSFTVMYNAHERRVQQICDWTPSNTSAPSNDASELEMRLLHYYTICTCQSFTSAVEFWKNWVPLVAFRNRPVFDALMSLSALHLHHQTDAQNAAVRAANTRLQDPSFTLQGRAVIAGVHDAFLGDNTRADIRNASLNYFQRAVQGHREALNNLDEADFEAAYLTSALIMGITFFLHVGGVGEDFGQCADERLWFSLGVAPRRLVQEGRARTGCNVTHLSGLAYEHPDLSDDSIFDRDHAKPFEILLTWGSEYVHQDPDDQEAYEDTVSYIGLMYTGIVNRSESAHATCRRILAAASCLPARFCEMVMEQHPRALTILAHLYAMAKLIAPDIPWYVGVAEHQVPSIHDRLPPAWRSVLAWPFAILAWDRASGEPQPVPPQTIA